MSQALKNVFSTMKQQGLAKKLDQYLLVSKHEDDADRKNVTNSPSSAGGCSRANIYQRMGKEKDPIDSRTRRIFDNGHHVHDRLQTYFEKMGILLMREVPLYHNKDEIQGHTDGLMDYTGKLKDIVVLEIKSINSRQFASLKQAKEDHVKQGGVYIHCLESARKRLRKRYGTYEDFKKSENLRRIFYGQRYMHLKGGRRYTREEKIAFKVGQHIQCDEILYQLKSPIKKIAFVYECKDTQGIKVFEVDVDMDVLDEVLDKYRDNNMYWKRAKRQVELGKTVKLPERECKNKTEGRFCNYVSICFPT